ncbi:MAG: NADPH-dependent F420 reductase [Dehalococcoidia bacterium]
MMNVGMIGAGNVGRSLTKASTQAGHRVAVSAASKAEAEEVSSEVGGTAVASNREAVANADIVILAVPFDAVESIVRELGSELDGKVVIDVTNKFEPTQLGGLSNAEQTQQMAPNARVVKAFNTVFAAKQSDPAIDGIQLDGFVAADDSDAKSKVIEFVQSLGFKPIDAGPLAMARALEGMGMLNISLNKNNGWPWQSGWKLLGPTGDA